VKRRRQEALGGESENPFPSSAFVSVEGKVERGLSLVSFWRRKRESDAFLVCRRERLRAEAAAVKGASSSRERERARASC